MPTNPPEPSDPPVFREFTWEGYRVRVGYGHIGTRPAIVAIELWGIEPVQRPWPHQPFVAGEGAWEAWEALSDQQVDTKALRKLPLGALLGRYIAQQHNRARRWQRRGIDPNVIAAYEEQFPTPKPGRGRRPKSDESLQVVADAYLRAKATRGMTIHYAVERAVGHRVKPGTVQRWVTMARDRGLLDPAPARRQQEPKPKKASQQRRKQA
jgi:hypothetical protein